jgi:hypothetical protein
LASRVPKQLKGVLSRPRRVVVVAEEVSSKALYWYREVPSASP